MSTPELPMTPLFNPESLSTLKIGILAKKSTKFVHICVSLTKVNKSKQAGTELGQAQLKLGLDCTLIFCRFCLFPFGLIVIVLV